MEINPETNVNSEATNPYDQLLADLSGAEEPSVETVPEEAPEVITDQPTEAPSGPPLRGYYNAPQAPVAAQTNEIPSAEEIIESIAKAVPNAAENPTEPAAEASEGELAPELDFNSEEFMDSFYDNPAEAVEKAADVIATKKVREVVSGLEKRLKPLLDESDAAQVKREIKATISDFVNTTADAQEMFPDIANYIKDNGLDPKDRRSYEEGYKEATLNRLRSENEALRRNQGRSLEDYLGDDAYLDQIAGNERVSKKAIENYLKTLQNGNKPVVIGGGGSSTAVPSAQPINNPQSIKDAAAKLREQLSK